MGVVPAVADTVRAGSAAPAATGPAEVAGQFTTLAVGFAVFQVFTVDYVEAEHRKAVVWNPGPPSSIAHAVRLIWPHRLRVGDVAWPPPAFPNDSFDRLPIGTGRCGAEWREPTT